MALSAAGALTFAGAMRHAAASDGRPSCIDDAMLVFDASGSMAATDFPDGAPSRMDRVRVALAKVLPTAARARRLGLIVYGPGRHFDTCRNIDLRLEPAPNAGERILNEIEALRPQGRTVLTASIGRAAVLLRQGRKPAVIVALTDGEGETPARLHARSRESNHP